MPHRLKSWCRGPDGARTVIVVIVLIAVTSMVILGVPVESAIAAMVGATTAAGTMIEVVYRTSRSSGSQAQVGAV